MITLQERLIDPSLKIQPFRRGRNLAKNLGGRAGNLVDSTLDAGRRQHRNYLEYLTDCYNSHYGIVVKPDMIWFTILNEVATHIKDNADHYEHLFTRSREGKIEITVMSDDPVVMPVEKLIEHLRVHVPVDVDQFLPEFSTTTDMARIAHFAAFCDAMSPYYSYGMMLCGISTCRSDDEGNPEGLEMKKEQRTVFIADDGEEFETAEECFEHEERVTEQKQKDNVLDKLIKSKIGQYKREELHFACGDRLKGFPTEMPWMTPLGLGLINISDMKRNDKGVVVFQLADEHGVLYDEGTHWVPKEAFYEELPK